MLAGVCLIMLSRAVVPGMSFQPPPGYRALRKGRVSLPGQAYLVTFTTAERRPLFAESRHAMTCCRVLTDSVHWGDATLLAWVLMPDHWHGLFVLGQRVALSAQVARIKGCSARALGKSAGQPLWASGFHDHAVRREQELVSVARYIVLNPIRAGLVTHCGLYPWWDAVWL